MEEVLAGEGADAVDFAAGVVLVVGEGEVGGVEGFVVVVVVVVVVFFMAGNAVHGAGDGRLGFCVVRGDFYFLEGQDFGPELAAETCSEGGGGG